MNIELTQKGRLLIAKISGELDHHAAPETRAKIDSELMSKAYKGLIVDMSNLSFMDSSGVGVVIGRYKLAKSLGANICVVGATGSIQKVLTVSGIPKIMQLYQTVSEAMKNM